MRKKPSASELVKTLRKAGVVDEKKLSHAMRLLVETNSLANSLSKMEDNRRSYKFLSDEMHDNGDPAYLMDDAVEKTGLALAAAVTYFYEYFIEAYGFSEFDNEEQKEQES